jgi:hypothetical protein
MMLKNDNAIDARFPGMKDVGSCVTSSWQIIQNGEIVTITTRVAADQKKCSFVLLAEA